uniref:Uncharacterized protein n=1 Tax=Tanacetum cinerariifolium TaxID=118510 RepID=A0A699GZ13_TANCI|nr:hypothetical protein [Tanacetum cinerariifolium]
MMSTPVFVNPESSTQADGAQSSRVLVPLLEDPYEAIRQAYLVRTDIESEPFEGKARTPESPHIVAPPTCHVEELEGSGTSSVRSTSSNSIAPLIPNHPLTHTTPALVSFLVGLHRFRSSYNSSPSSTLLVQKRYRGTSELILGTDSEEDKDVEESLDSNSESEGAENEGPTAEDKDLAAWDEGLATGVEVPDVDDESYGLDDESYGLNDESHDVDDDSRGLDEEGHSVEINGLGLEEDRRLYMGVSSRQLRLWGQLQPTPTTWTYSEDDMVYIDVPIYPPPAPPVQTPPLPEWMSGSLPISPSPSVVPSSVSSPMIPLIVPSPIASLMATLTTTIPVDEDQFIEIDRDVRELYTRSGAVRGEIFSQRYRFKSLEHEQQRTVMTFEALWRPVLALEAWARRVDTQMTDMSQTGNDNHILVYDMLLQQTTLQQEL